MENETNDSKEELINSEQLQVFDVIEEYCEVCGDITPHHIDSPRKFSDQEHDFDVDTIFCDPLSTKECVRCRENEENKLDLFIQ